MKKTLTLAFILGLFAQILFAQNQPVCITASPSPADNCEDACLTCTFIGYIGHTDGFTAGNPNLFCGTVENDQWFGFRAAGNTSSFVVTPSNCLNNKGLEVAIYKQCTSAPLTCAIGANGSAPVSVGVVTIPGQTYFLMIDGKGGDVCDFIVNTSSVAPVPVGPTAAIQGSAHGTPFSQKVYSVPAVSGAGFYTWTAPPGAKINGQNGPLQVPAPNGNQVTITFGLTSGDVCVQPGNPCVSGTLVCKPVAVMPNTYLAPPCPASDTPTAENCAAACVFCDFTGFSGSTAGYTASAATGFCGTIENDQWFGFVAGSTTATLTAISTNCTIGNGLQLGIYEECNGDTLPAGCYEGCAACMTTPASLTVNLTPGHTYFVIVDGYAGDECDFTLNITPPVAGTAVPIGSTGPIQGPATVCPGATAIYSIPPTSGAGGYTWSVPAGTLINGQPSPYFSEGSGSNIVQVDFGSVAGQVCVEPKSSCAGGDLSCKTITFAPIPPTILPPVTVCNEDLPYELPWGVFVTVSATYQKNLVSSQGCDSLVKQQVIVKPPIVKNLAPQTICAGDAVVICGTAYTETGTYDAVCTSFQGCDSTVHFSVLVLEPVAEISGGNMLSCDNTFITLTAAPSPGTKIWRDPAGTVLGTGNTLTVQNTGTYILTVTASAGSVMCMAMDTVVVGGNTIPPTASASADSLTCSNPIATLQGGSSSAGAQFSWSGPGGFTSALQNPAVNQAGTYTLVVTAANGCSNSATTEVILADTVPSAILGAGQITCSFPIQTISLQTSASNPSYSWEGPNGLASTVQNPSVAEPGTYTVTITDGITTCLSVASFTVTADVSVPGAGITSDPITCVSPAGVLHGNSPTSGVIYTWIWPGGTLDQQDIPVISLDTYTLVVTAPNGCTSSATGAISVDTDAPTASVNDVILTCAVTSATLHGESDTPGVDYTWIGPGIVLQQQDIEVSQPGAYILIVTAPNGCTASATGLVLEDIILPLFSPNAGKLSCTNQSAFIDCGCGDGNNFMISWTGPNGFTASTASATVTVPGVYQLEVTSLINGCSSTATVTVAADFAPPFITLDQVTDDQNSQGIGAIDITIDGGTMPYSVEWYWNGLLFTNAEDPILLIGGTYIGIANGANGCSDTISVIVQNIVPTQEALAQNRWEVFPNPSDHYLNIRYKGGNMPDAQFRLLDASGRIVLEDNTKGLALTSFDLSTIPAGAYAFCIYTHEGLITKIVSIQH